MQGLPNSSGQLELNFDEVRPVDPHLTEAEKPRLTRQALQVRDRLAQGPATNKELIQIAQRFGARIHDLRKHGYEIDVVSRCHETGLFVYEMRRQK